VQTSHIRSNGSFPFNASFFYEICSVSDFFGSTGLGRLSPVAQSISNFSSSFGSFFGLREPKREAFFCSESVFFVELPGLSFLACSPSPFASSFLLLEPKSENLFYGLSLS
jgi:hypothetical protein